MDFFLTDYCNFERVWCIPSVLIISRTDAMIRGKTSLGSQVRTGSKRQADAFDEENIFLVNKGDS